MMSCNTHGSTMGKILTRRVKNELYVISRLLNLGDVLEVPGNKRKHKSWLLFVTFNSTLDE